MNWKLRGIGLMYTKLNMILAAHVVNNRSVRIVNVWSSNETSHSPPRDDCDKLTVWVRVYGPEIFAGNAQTVPATAAADCSWEFDFEVSCLLFVERICIQCCSDLRLTRGVSFGPLYLLPVVTIPAGNRSRGV